NKRANARCRAVLIRPVDWRKDRSAQLASTDQGPDNGLSVRRLDLCELALRKAERIGIARMDFDERLGDMDRKPRHEAGTRHRVPLVAHAPGVEHEGPFIVYGRGKPRRRDGDYPRAPVPRLYPSLAKQPFGSLRTNLRHRPLHRFELIVSFVRQPSQTSEVE